jgi:hypothetical protein
MKKSILGIAVMFLFAFAQEPNVEYNPNNQARIRLFGQNGRPTIMVSGIDCKAGNKGEEVNIGGSMGDAFGSLFGSAKNVSLGIPQTEATKTISEQNGILSKAIYKEFAIPANKPVNIRSAFIGLSNVSHGKYVTIVQDEGNCNSKTVSFVPEAGKDYEVISLQKGEKCALPSVFEVITENSQTKLKEVATNEAVKCD